MSQADKRLKIFSPDGRIYQIEYAFKAIQQFGQTSIAIKGKDSVVVCCPKKVPDKLIVPESVTNVFNISDTHGAIIVGNMNDARFVVSWLRQQAALHRHKFHYEAPLHVLAQRYADQMHRFSQQVGMRPLCISLTLVGVDEEFGPQVFRIDPSGQAIGFKGVSSGTKEQEAMTQLEKQFKKAGAGDWDSRKTVEVAIQVMQGVTSSDFKADEIEIGFANAANPLFRKLTESEIETVLNDLADRN